MILAMQQFLNYKLIEMVNKQKSKSKSDKRNQRDPISKSRNDKEMNKIRKLYDTHRDNFQRKQRKRNVTSVIFRDSRLNSCEKFQMLEKLQDFDDQIDVEDFQPIVYSESSTVMKSDEQFSLKFPNIASFDSFMTKNQAEDMIRVFKSYYELNKPSKTTDCQQKVTRLLNEVFPGGFSLKNEFADIEEYLESLNLDSTQNSKANTKARVYKQQNAKQSMKDKCKRKILKPEERILIYSLQLKAIPQKKIAEIAKINIGTVGSTINRMKNGTITKSWDVDRINRKLLSFDQLNSLFAYLDSQQGDEPAYKVVKNFLRKKQDIGLKKTYCYSLLRQGNFTIKKGDIVGAKEAFDVESHRKFLWNLYLMGLISSSQQPHYVTDEFGVQLTRDRPMVICRKGSSKRKFQKKYDKKINVAITVDDKGVFSWMFAYDGQTSISQDYFIIKTFKQIKKTAPDSTDKWLTADNALFHSFLPTINQIEDSNAKSNKKVRLFFNSNNLSKISKVERVINLIKKRIGTEKCKNLTELVKKLDTVIRGISSDDMLGVNRYSAKDWIEFTGNSFQRVQGEKI